VRPADARVGAGDDGALAAVAERPRIVRVDLGDAVEDGGRGVRGGRAPRQIDLLRRIELPRADAVHVRDVRSAGHCLHHVEAAAGDDRVRDPETATARAELVELREDGGLARGRKSRKSLLHVAALGLPCPERLGAAQIRLRLEVDEEIGRARLGRREDRGVDLVAPVRARRRDRGRR
jgi:hypothetical protein